MTEAEVEEDLQNRLREMRLLPSPVVQVFITLKRSQFFSAIGSVRANGPFALIRPDTRLLDVLAQIGDVDALAGRLFVIRRNDSADRTAPGQATEPTTSPDLVAPPPDDEPSFSGEGGGARLASDSRPAQEPPSNEMDLLVRPGASRTPGETSPRPLVYDPAAGAMREAGSPAQAPAPPARLDRYDWEDVPEYELSQTVLEIDLKALRSGDPKQNIVIRDRDVLYVPVDTGIFYMMGEINRPGVYSFDNREITIKQAIGAIGAGFTPLAWPQRCEIIRREPGTDKQLTIPVDVDAVYAGLADDVLLRDGDLVNVGTHIAAPFLFVIRNSFRFTYGFGFVYDRNFADQDAISNRENPETVARRERALTGLPF
jgi:protein involved in polysaccharide export with SLBB domain